MIECVSMAETSLSALRLTPVVPRPIFPSASSTRRGGLLAAQRPLSLPASPPRPIAGHVVRGARFGWQ
jgi:hypothetical protein